MPDDALQSDLTPETPAEAQTLTPPTPPEHDDPGEIAAEASTSLAQKLTAAVGGVAEKYGLTFKRGRGRPKKDGSPKISDLLVAPDGTASPAVAQPALVAALPVDRTAHDNLLHRAIIGAAKGALGGLRDVCRAQALAAGLDKPFVDATLADARPDPEALADFSESLDLVLKKYDVSTEYTPEVSLLLSTGRLAAPYWLLWREFSGEIARKRDREKADKA